MRQLDVVASVASPGKIMIRFKMSKKNSMAMSVAIPLLEHDPVPPVGGRAEPQDEWFDGSTSNCGDFPMMSNCKIHQPCFAMSNVCPKIGYPKTPHFYRQFLIHFSNYLGYAQF